MGTKKMPKNQLDELVDLKSVVIDRSLPVEQRVHSYICVSSWIHSGQYRRA